MATTPCWSAARCASPVLRRSLTSEIPKQWAFVAARSPCAFIIFVTNTITQHTQLGQWQSIQYKGNLLISDRFQIPIQVLLPQQDGLCAVAFLDDHYPVRTAFSLLNKSWPLSRSADYDDDATVVMQ
ncbi:unnamed protein product [Miscanthus lutarioriparius]|uniref:Uncharacterized protein n=1 Tax=Miscanthus lutarioriparius TaxID=422564 RepID=A0A811RQT9_9POAL|nr:unnamed protein product [Miscanthus lutarioriparius]